jgi:hypothetical protein
MPIYESIGTAENVSTDWINLAGSFDPAFSDRSLRTVGAGYVRMKVRAPSQNVWFRYLIRTNTDFGVNSGGTALRFAWVYSSTGVLLVEVIALNPGTSQVITVRYRNGGVLVTHPTTFILNNNQLYMLDFHVVTSLTTGRVEIYQDDIQIYNITGLNNTTDNVDRLESYSSDLGAPAATFRHTYLSEFLIGIGEDSPTIGRRVFSRFPSANSAVNTAWIGDFNQISTGPRRTDGDMVYTDSAGQREGYTITAAPLLNARIEAVAVNTHAFIGDGSPRQLRHSVRIGGVDYDQVVQPVGRIPLWYETVMYQNPATLGAWTVPAFNGSEWGFIST